MSLLPSKTHLLLLLTMLSLSCLSFLVLLSISFSSALPNPGSPGLPKRQVGGNSDDGWTNVPTIEGSTFRRDWPMKGATFVRLCLYYAAIGTY